MRKLATIALVFALAAGSFTILCTRASAQGNAPQWTIGDYWEYSAQGTQMGNQYNMSLRLEVKERTAITVGTTTSDAYRLEAAMQQTYNGMTVTITGSYYVRASDLATIKIDVSYGQQMIISFDPPLDTLRFPLTSGISWSTTTNATMQQGPSMDSNIMQVDHVSTGPVATSVPAGAFSAFVVDQKVQNQTMGQMYYSDVVGYYVKLVMVYSSSPSFSFELKSYKYQKPNLEMTVVLTSAILIVVIVAAVIGFLMWRASKRAKMTQLAQQQIQPPPPPGGQQQPPPYQPPPPRQP